MTLVRLTGLGISSCGKAGDVQASIVPAITAPIATEIVKETLGLPHTLVDFARF